MSILKKSILAIGLGIAGYSWPYIQNGINSSFNKIPGLLPTAITLSKPYLLGTPHLTGLHLLGAFIGGSLFLTKYNVHTSDTVNVFERGIQGISWYTTAIIGGALSSSILYTFARSPHPILNAAIFITGAALTGTFIGSKAPKLIDKPLYVLCDLIDRGVSTIVSVVEDQILYRAAIKDIISNKENPSTPDSNIQR